MILPVHNNNLKKTWKYSMAKKLLYLSNSSVTSRKWLMESNMLTL